MLSLISEYRRRWEGFAPQLRQLYLFSGLQQIGLGAAGLIYVMRLSQLGWDEVGIARLAAIGLAAGALAALPIGMVVSRKGYRNSVIISSVGLSISAALRSVVVHPWAFYVLAVIDGISLVGLYTAYGPFLFEVTSPAERSHAYSLDFFLVSLCTPGGAFIAGMLLQQGRLLQTASIGHTLQAVMACAALLMAFSVIPLLTIEDPTLADSTDLGEALAGRRRTPRLWLLVGIQLFSAALFSAAVSHLQPVSVIYLGEHLGLTTLGIGVVNGFVTVFSSAVVLSTPVLVKRLGTGGALVVTQSASLLALGTMAASLRLPVAVSGYLVFSAAVQSSGPLRERLALEAWPGRDRSIASGSLYALQNGGGALGAALGGWLTLRGGFGLSLTMAASLSAASVALLPLLPWARIRKQSPLH